MTDGIQLDRCHPGKFRIHVSSSSDLHLIKETFACFIKFLGRLVHGQEGRFGCFPNVYSFSSCLEVMNILLQQKDLANHPFAKTSEL